MRIIVVLSFLLGSVLFSQQLPDKNIQFSEKIDTLFVEPQKGFPIVKTENKFYALDSSGEVIWENTIDFFDKHSSFKVLPNNRLIVENKKPTKKEDQLRVYDVSSGKLLWGKKSLSKGNYQFSKLIGSSLYVVSSKDVAMLDINTGNSLWSKNYKMNKVRGVKKDSSGVLLVSDTQQMLLTNTGNPLWKKSRKLESEVKPSDKTTLDYQNGSIEVTPSAIIYNNKQGNEKWKLSIGGHTKMTYDDEYKNIIVLKGNVLYVINPDNIPSGKLKQTLLVRDPRQINYIEPIERGYFMSSPSVFVIVDKNGKLLIQRTYEKPYDLSREIIDLQNGVKEIFSVFDVFSGVLNMFDGIQRIAQGALFLNPIAFINGINKIGKGANKIQSYESKDPNYIMHYQSQKIMKDYAFFFEKKGLKRNLLMIDKSTGLEIERFWVDTDYPIYTVSPKTRKLYLVNDKVIKTYNY